MRLPRALASPSPQSASNRCGEGLGWRGPSAEWSGQPGHLGPVGLRVPRSPGPLCLRMKPSAPPHWALAASLGLGCLPELGWPRFHPGALGPHPRRPRPRPAGAHSMPITLGFTRLSPVFILSPVETPSGTRSPTDDTVPAWLSHSPTLTGTWHGEEGEPGATHLLPCQAMTKVAPGSFSFFLCWSCLSTLLGARSGWCPVPFALCTHGCLHQVQAGPHKSQTHIRNVGVPGWAAQVEDLD